jgi:transketolase
MTSTQKRLSIDDFKRARKRLLTMHFQAGVGHIGGNLSAIDALLVLLHEYVTSDDTFILSKGHSAGALYVALWSTGRLSDEQLATFHKDDTLLAGHPPAHGIPEIPFATGSLGHGLSLAAGTALGLRLRGRDARVFCMTSDGEWQEGSTWEALIFACHHRLANLTIVVDHNNLQGFGKTASVASMSPLWEKIERFDIDIDVVDGHDAAAIRTALDRSSQRPHLVVLETKKGSGVSYMEERMEWHYLPLDEPQYRRALEEIDRA